jgi:hypothetical protein
VIELRLDQAIPSRNPDARRPTDDRPAGRERERTDACVGPRHDNELFGHCTNHGAGQSACPKDISVDYIARLNRDLRKAKFLRDGD